MAPRARRWTAGTRAYSRFMASGIARSGCGMIHGAERWNTVRLRTRGWIAGPIWMADAPVPTMPTRRPSSGVSWSHWAEWNTSPSNASNRSGTRGLLSRPGAAIRRVGPQRPLRGLDLATPRRRRPSARR